MGARNSNLGVKKNEQGEPTDFVIAKHIIDIAEAFRRMEEGPLKRETIEVLIHAHTKVPKKQITKVLDSLGKLRNLYLKPDKDGQTK